MAAKLDYVGARKGVKSMVGYLSAALDQDFGGAGEAETAPARHGDRAERLRRVQQAVSARSPTQRDADKRLFMGRIADPAARSDFERFGWMSALNAQAIFAFWDEMHPGLFEADG